MNWLLGKNRYNPLIRPASNRTERVPVKLQVSLAQLISVVRLPNSSVQRQIAAARADRRGGETLEGVVDLKEKAVWRRGCSSENCSAVISVRSRLELQREWIKRGHKAFFSKVRGGLP